MRKILSLMLCCSILLAGCAGREPHPIATHQPGDENMSCTALFAEMENCKKEMEILEPKTNKAFTNTLWLIAGIIFIVPVFFMDVKDAEKIEYRAFRQRHDHLEVLAKEKNCYAADPRQRDRKVLGYRIDTSQRDESGNFLRTPIFEDEGKK